MQTTHRIEHNQAATHIRKLCKFEPNCRKWQNGSLKPEIPASQLPDKIYNQNSQRLYILEVKQLNSINETAVRLHRNSNMADFKP